MPLTPEHITDAWTHAVIAGWAVMGVVGMLAVCEASKPPAWLSGVL